MSRAVNRQSQRRLLHLMAAMLVLQVVGCASPKVHMWRGVHEAVAVVYPTEGNACHGIVRFQQLDEGVRISATLAGLTPSAEHAMHVHRYGDASSPAGTSAGGFYACRERNGDVQFPGDLGMVAADSAGKASYVELSEELTVAGLDNPIIGRAVVVHAPAEAAGRGRRIGVGVIGIAHRDGQ